jgi:hypothetical protein
MDHSPLASDFFNRLGYCDFRRGIRLAVCRASAPYQAPLCTQRPRDPNRVRVDAVKAAVVQQIFGWYTDRQQPVSLYGVAKQLNDDGIPAPRSGKHWSAAAICLQRSHPFCPCPATQIGLAGDHFVLGGATRRTEAPHNKDNSSLKSGTCTNVYDLKTRASYWWGRRP